MSTGIAGLDKALDGGLHAGLTVLGAVSSMGKTSLMLQMADTLAAAGRNVLFITIEMSRMELIAKSAVRGTKERARPLLDGKLPEEKVRGLISAYRQKTGGRVELWEPDAPLTPAFLDEKVSAFCAQHESPVLFLDYLQLVAPAHTGVDRGAGLLTAVVLAGLVVHGIGIRDERDVVLLQPGARQVGGGGCGNDVIRHSIFPLCSIVGVGCVD